jgi:hypothetical protein
MYLFLLASGGKVPGPTGYGTVPNMLHLTCDSSWRKNFSLLLPGKPFLADDACLP